MSVKIIIKRKFRKNSLQQVIPLLQKIRSKANEQIGYVYGETLLRNGYPHEVLIISSWNSISDWNKWKVNPVRQEYENILLNLQSNPTEYKDYILGTSTLMS
jgi:heme-degrading monooxygenase HmoA